MHSSDAPKMIRGCELPEARIRIANPHPPGKMCQENFFWFRALRGLSSALALLLFLPLQAAKRRIGWHFC